MQIAMSNVQQGWLSSRAPRASSKPPASSTAVLVPVARARAAINNAPCARRSIAIATDGGMHMHNSIIQACALWVNTPVFGYYTV
jgi:hypothetical protein